MSHPPRRYWEDNYQARARDVPDPEAGGGMSAEGRADISRANELVAKAHRRARGDIAVAMQTLALEYAALEARLAEAERRDCEKATDLVNAGLHARKLKGRLAEAERRAKNWRKKYGAAGLRIAEAEEILHMATAPRRRDGTYNYSREAFEQMANEYFAAYESGTPTTKGTP